MSEIASKRRKFGPWKKADKDFIAANCDTMSVNDIAEVIDRDPESVSKYIRKTLGLRIAKANKKNVNIFSNGTEIEKSFIWATLQQEFSEDELKTFLYHWGRIITQFKDDVFPTEEMQIVDTIKLEILQGRCLKKQQEVIRRLNEIQNEINELTQEDATTNAQRIDNLEHQSLPLRQSLDNYADEFNALLQRKSAMLKELKATRDQRLKRIEDSKQTFTGWMSEIMTNVSLRKELGIYIEKHRLATNVEELRLTEPLKYADGDIDLPLLTAETLNKLENKLQKEENEEGNDNAL